MATMRDIRRRIRSVQSTQQITRAMKMVAAAKLRRIQDKTVLARPYADKMREVMGHLLAASPGFAHPFLEEREKKKSAYVLLTGDRGLCGSYNANVIRLAEVNMRAAGGEACLVAVGRKGRDYFRRREFPVLAEFVDIGDDPTYIQARELARYLMDIFKDGTVDEINVVYTEFISAIRYRPVLYRLLPVSPDSLPEARLRGQIDYIYEPSPVGVLGALFPRYVEVMTYRAFLESKASEHAARMTAMDNATDNAQEMIEKLTLSFNRARQAAITKEIMDIMGGAEALTRG